MNSHLRQIILDTLHYGTTFIIPQEVIKIIADEYLLRIESNSWIDIKYTTKNTNFNMRVSSGITLVDNIVYFYIDCAEQRNNIHGYSFDIITNESLPVRHSDTSLLISDIDLIRTQITGVDKPIAIRYVDFPEEDNIYDNDNKIGVTIIDNEEPLYGISSLHTSLVPVCKYLGLSSKLKIIFSQTNEKNKNSFVIFMHDLLEVNEFDQKIYTKENRLIRLGTNAKCINCTIIEEANQVLFVTHERIMFCTIKPFRETKILDFDKKILAACDNGEYLFVLVSKSEQKSNVWIDVYDLESFKNCSEIKLLNNVLCDSFQTGINTIQFLMSANDHALVITDGFEFRMFHINRDITKKYVKI